MGRLLLAFVRDESGATAIEYGLLAAGIAIVMTTSLTQVSCSLTNIFSKVSSELKAQ
ncbi:Flp family type IVb pilin [Methyloceanibacter methanicus]|uniref:Flp family type IVb pilin n=1 Tax=Methyloceanibacter methanicus TaxID=1774968 RepID=UPI0009F2B8D6|nr:Flp family type IVb pilin [Methyloceanibacter methanicus]